MAWIQILFIVHVGYTIFPPDCFWQTRQGFSHWMLTFGYGELVAETKWDAGALCSFSQRSSNQDPWASLLWTNNHWNSRPLQSAFRFGTLHKEKIIISLIDSPFCLLSLGIHGCNSTTLLLAGLMENSPPGGHIVCRTVYIIPKVYISLMAFVTSHLSLRILWLSRCVLQDTSTPTLFCWLCNYLISGEPLPRWDISFVTDWTHVCGTVYTVQDNLKWLYLSSLFSRGRIFLCGK